MMPAHVGGQLVSLLPCGGSLCPPAPANPWLSQHLGAIIKGWAWSCDPGGKAFVPPARGREMLSEGGI